MHPSGTEPTNGCTVSSCTTISNLCLHVPDRCDPNALLSGTFPPNLQEGFWKDPRLVTCAWLASHFSRFSAPALILICLMICWFRTARSFCSLLRPVCASGLHPCKEEKHNLKLLWHFLWVFWPEINARLCLLRARLCPYRCQDCPVHWAVTHNSNWAPQLKVSRICMAKQKNATCGRTSQHRKTSPFTVISRRQKGLRYKKKRKRTLQFQERHPFSSNLTY